MLPIVGDVACCLLCLTLSTHSETVQVQEIQVYNVFDFLDELMRSWELTPTKSLVSASDFAFVALS